MVSPSITSTTVPVCRAFAGMHDAPVISSSTIADELTMLVGGCVSSKVGEDSSKSVDDSVDGWVGDGSGKSVGASVDRNVGEGSEAAVNVISAPIVAAACV